MFDYLAADLPRPHALRVWHAMRLTRIDAKSFAVQKRETEQEHGLLARLPEPEWVVELGTGDDRPPVEVHVGHRYAIGQRRRPVSRDKARRLLDAGLRACSHCTPDTLLDIPLSSRPALAAAAH
ncbi:DUF6233 domain-containing protein [Streptomyces sp. NBC_00414]|uniref:DUF6233 domain-containing protein n=1 Tax=Streptomyces sp. NBC_00414 TaxID=2975739 RepID=UPI002E22AF4A